MNFQRWILFSRLTLLLSALFSPRPFSCSALQLCRFFLLFAPFTTSSLLSCRFRHKDHFSSDRIAHFYRRCRTWPCILSHNTRTASKKAVPFCHRTVTRHNLGNVPFLHLTYQPWTGAFHGVHRPKDTLTHTGKIWPIRMPHRLIFVCKIY